MGLYGLVADGEGGQNVLCRHEKRPSQDCMARSQANGQQISSPKKKGLERLTYDIFLILTTGF